MKRYAGRSVVFLIAAMLLTWLGGRGLKVQDDPVASLNNSPLFTYFYDRSPFKGKIYVDGVTDALDKDLQALGYTPFSPAADAEAEAKAHPEALLSLVPLLADADLAAAASAERRATILTQAQAALALPGGTAFLQELAGDPLLLRQLVVEKLLAPLLPKSAGGRIASYKSPVPQSFPTIGKAYDALVAAGPGVHFIGGDVFAYENYLAVKSDIAFCMLVSIPLNLILFFLFVRRGLFLLFLVVGSFLSYATGLVTVRLFYDHVYALVFAFTSTFIGFNNEYLVHLSGLDRGHLKRTLVSLGSAIGTTLIGFLVLLGSSSPIIRQMALVSVGAMAGFILFLLAYQPVLETIRIRNVSWPQLPFGPKSLVFGWIACAAVCLAAGMPEVRTSIETFKYTTPRLDAEVAHFQKRLPQVDLSDFRALPVEGDEYAAWQAMPAGTATFHPLSVFKSSEAQAASIAKADAALVSAREAVHAALLAKGILLPKRPAAPLVPVRASAFLATLSALSPVPWAAVVAGQAYIFYPQNAAKAAPTASVPVSPKHYYDALLTDLGRQMGLCFLAGLGIMVAYLVPLQRGFLPILYIFSPLAVFAALMTAWCAATGTPLNVIHFMGFALVIAVAVDYTAIAVSTGYNRAELNKILLTGLSTLASFGVLCFARHPLLRDLGIVVTAGVGLALGYTLLTRFHARRS